MSPIDSIVFTFEAVFMHMGNIISGDWIDQLATYSTIYVLLGKYISICFEIWQRILNKYCTPYWVKLLALRIRQCGNCYNHYSWIKDKNILCSLSSYNLTNDLMTSVSSSSTFYLMTSDITKCICTGWYEMLTFWICISEIM